MYFCSKENDDGLQLNCLTDCKTDLTPRISAVAILALLWSLCWRSDLSSAQQQTSSLVRVVHISVLVRQLDGDPIGYLRSGDFHVLLHDLRLPLTETRPGESPKINTQKNTARVLVIFSQNYTTTADATDSLLNHLPSSFNGSSISIVESNGTATNYVSTRRRLLANLRSGHAVKETYRQAFDQLGTHTGRRALIYVTSKRERTPLDIRVAAARAGALIYQVGGDPADNYTYEGDTTTTPSLPAYGEGIYGSTAAPDNGMTVFNNTQIWESFATRIIRDVRIEKTMRAALHDIAKDNEGYYDLQVQVPADAKTLTLGLGIKEDYQLSAQAYSLDDFPVPELKLQSK